MKKLCLIVIVACVLLTMCVQIDQPKKHCKKYSEITAECYSGRISRSDVFNMTDIPDSIKMSVADACEIAWDLNGKVSKEFVIQLSRDSCSSGYVKRFNEVNSKTP